MRPYTTTISRPVVKSDYSLTGANSTLAVEKGLAEADWYRCPVPRETMRSLLERRDGPAIRDTLLWFALILGCGVTTYLLRETFWIVFPYAMYCTLYASSSDSRWHESGHGTAFRSDWMNNTLYEIASFMVMRESTVWRWSHNRHHSDTLIVGRDPEIAVPRPPDITAIILSFFNLKVYPKYFRRILLHCTGRMTADEKTFIPTSEFSKVYRRARIYVAVYAAVITISIYTHSILPLLFVGTSQSLRDVAFGHVRTYTTCWPGRECSRSSSQFQVGVHEPDSQVSLLEHELSPGAPFISAGAVPRAAALARSSEGRLPHTLSQPPGGVARDHSGSSEAGQGSGISHQAETA